MNLEVHNQDVDQSEVPVVILRTTRAARPLRAYAVS